MQYHAALQELCEALYRGFALSLDLDEHTFTPMLTKPIAELRLLHYPPQSGIDDNVLGIGAHSDYDVFTVLATDDVPALEILNPGGEWIAAPPIADAFIVNVGDLLQRWTNDLYRSTVHRAINRSGRRRYSLVFFSNVDPLETVAVLPSCQSPQRPARYSPIVVADYVESCMQEAYGVSAGPAVTTPPKPTDIGSMNDSGRESANSEKAADQEVHEWAMGDLNPRPLPCKENTRHGHSPLDSDRVWALTWGFVSAPASTCRVHNRRIRRSPGCLSPGPANVVDRRCHHPENARGCPAEAGHPRHCRDVVAYDITARRSTTPRRGSRTRT